MCLCIIHLALIVLISHGILLVRYCLNTPAPTTQKEKHTHYCVLVEKFDFEKFLIGGVTVFWTEIRGISMMLIVK